jgi:hypothetical protein
MQEKTLAMLHQIYRATIGSPATSLAALRRLTDPTLLWDGARNVTLMMADALPFPGSPKRGQSREAEASRRSGRRQ